MTDDNPLVEEGVSSEYFHTKTYLHTSKESGDPNLCCPEMIEHILTYCFPDRKGKLFDWGAGPGIWIDIATRLGFDARGVDFNPQGHPKVAQGDMLTYWEESFLPCRYAVCTSVLLYRSKGEILQFLHSLYRSFWDSAFIYTPDSRDQIYMDEKAISFVSAVWLMEMCQTVGGHPVILNFDHRPQEQSGPSVLWLRHKDYRRLQTIADDFRALKYYGFTVGI